MLWKVGNCFKWFFYDKSQVVGLDPPLFWKGRMLCRGFGSLTCKLTGCMTYCSLHLLAGPGYFWPYFNCSDFPWHIWKLFLSAQKSYTGILEFLIKISEHFTSVRLLFSPLLKFIFFPSYFLNRQYMVFSILQNGHSNTLTCKTKILR